MLLGYTLTRAFIIYSLFELREEYKGVKLIKNILILG